MDAHEATLSHSIFTAGDDLPFRHLSPQIQDHESLDIGTSLLPPQVLRLQVPPIAKCPMTPK